MASRSTFAKRLAVLALRLEAYRPFIRASVVITRKPCIREGCRACREGRKHASPLLTASVRGKAKNRYLPKRLIGEARRRTENYRKSKAILEQMSEIWLEELLSRRG
ncbi:MAG: DUF6788 family protein [Elusimicrobiota bacterium]